MTRSTASSAPTYGQAEAFCCRRWGFYSKRVGEGYVGVSAVTVNLPLLYTHILFMYHRRCIILAVDSIVKYDTTQFPFYPVPVHVCSAHRFTSNYHAMLCCSTAPCRITSQNCFWLAGGLSCGGPGRSNTLPNILECLISIYIEADTDGAACAEREITS